MLYEIKRWDGTVLYSMETDSLKAAVEAAVASGADLRGADLSGANLSGANLIYANLRYANLSGANLSDANLRYANLSGADLSGANLSGANLRGADLSGANLRGADLSDADLIDANLSDADLSDANLSGADLRDADDLRVAGVPFVENLHQAMLAAIETSNNPEGGLNMSDWHTCETTHCRAGWAITLAGPAGKALEFAMGSSAAGALIHLASCPWMETVPNFYASNEEALADIKACAERERQERA